jgi:polysaccharide export outer membrane protein
MLVALCLSGLLSACAAGAANVVAGGERFSENVDVAQDYKLGIGDRVKIVVFEEPSLSGEFTVDATGTISLALIGDIKVLDRTTAEVEDGIEAGLRQGYLREPKVTVEIVSFRPFFILGEVNAPGQYPYANGLTVMNAIATARGFSPRAQRKRVYIRRAGEADERLYNLTPALKVYPGDTIRLGERYF